MGLIELISKIKLSKTLNPDEKSCDKCFIREMIYDSTGRMFINPDTALCEDLLNIFRRRYNLEKTTNIFGKCPIPFMDPEDLNT